MNFFFAVLVALSAVLPKAATAQESILDVEAYHRAVDFCRQQSWPGFTLDPDKHILCFGARIPDHLDVSEAKGLRQDGLFVVRSRGGDSGSAIALAEIVRDRHATVVVYDYCLSACASFLLIASHLAYVVKGTLVAWHNFTGEGLCTHLVQQGSGPKKLERGPCKTDLTSITPSDDYRPVWPQITSYLSERTIRHTGTRRTVPM